MKRFMNVVVLSFLMAASSAPVKASDCQPCPVNSVVKTVYAALPSEKLLVDNMQKSFGLVMASVGLIYVLTGFAELAVKAFADTDKNLNRECEAHELSRIRGALKLIAGASLGAFGSALLDAARK
ncbi:MAG: hypothetical protein AB7R69_02535 [Candidatus Babeliales bacterium]